MEENKVNYESSNQNEIFEKLDEKLYFNKINAALYLDIKLKTLNTYAKKRLIPWSRIGKSMIFSKKDLDNFFSGRLV